MTIPTDHPCGSLLCSFDQSARTPHEPPLMTLDRFSLSFQRHPLVSARRGTMVKNVMVPPKPETSRTNGTSRMCPDISLSSWVCLDNVLQRSGALDSGLPNAETLQNKIIGNWSS